MPGPKVIDLFAGAGGFSLGAHLAGFSPKLAIEIDSDLGYSRFVNFPGSQTVFGDITEIEPRDALRIANLAPTEVTGVIGGPPCQGFSEMGKRDPEDERNALVGRFFDYVIQIEPRFFVMENVPGILHPDLRSYLDNGLDRVAGRYEILGPVILDAKEFGAATTRERVVVLGYRPQYVNRITEAELSAARLGPATVEDAILDIPSPKSAERDAAGNSWGRYNPEFKRLSSYARKARRSPPRGLGSKESRAALRDARVSGIQPTYHTPEVISRFAALKQGEVDPISKYPRLRWNGISTTLRAGTGRDRGSFQAARPIHPEQNRVITVREAARLQGFPDWFQFHPTIWHSFRMIGNSVSPYFAEAILAILRRKLET
jgi:DNA (cytosine-5)-methyltransferase 1